jgi:hypothetical protein
MAVSIAQYVDLLFKKLQGVAKTANATVKGASNESIASPAFLRGDVVWMQANQIPATAQTVGNITLALTGTNAIECTADTTVPPIGGVRPTWLTGESYWISQEFGATWLPKIYVGPAGAANIEATGTQIFSAGIGGVGEYYFDTQAGVLNFIGETIPTVLTAGNVVYVAGYQYVGGLGVTNIPSGANIGNLQVNGTTITANSGNLITIGNALSATGNVTAPYFIGDLIGNITGNIDAGGANTDIQFNDNNLLAGSAAFTFNKTSNLVAITGNVTAGNVTSQGIVTANLGVYGDIYTTSIDSADSSAIIVTPDMILLASLDVNQDITVGNIVIPSSGNITVGNVRIANLATPIFNQDAVTKQYVDSAIGNVLPIITNQTINPDGSSLTYTLDQSTIAVGILVTVNGISQTPGDSYAVAGDQITFAEVLLTTDVVQVRFLSGTSSGGGGGVQSSIANGTSNVNLATANGNATITANAVTYTFGTNSTLTLPGGSRLRPLGSNLDIFAGTGSYVQLINSDESSSMGVDGSGGYIVTAGGIWGFSTTGNLTAPGNVSAVGNITGAYVKGNGSELTNLPAPSVAQDIASTGDMSIMTYDGNLKYVSYATIEPASGNIKSAGNISATGNVQSGNIRTAGQVSATGNIVTAGNFVGNGATLANVATKFSGTISVPTGNSTQSFTVDAGHTYQLWLDCNIPNGILVWNATATITNTNVPVVGDQYAWVYNGGGTPIDFTSIPNQFTGSANTIVRSSVAPSATTNRFDFGINNASGNIQTIRYGWVRIS